MNMIARNSKRKLLFISKENLSGDLAWQLKRNGHEVKAYIETKEDVDVYTGFIERIKSWKPYKNWADVIIFDDVGFGEIADSLRKQGKLVIGGSKYTDRLEKDRKFGQLELKKYGINILPSWQFSDYDKAMCFIRKNPMPYIFKPSSNRLQDGENKEYEKDLIVLGEEKNGKDLLEFLEQNKIILQKKCPTFLIQKFVRGVEVAVGAFFNGKEFIYPININFEHKRFFPGNIGPFTGEMGTLMYWSSSNTLFRATLKRMLPALKESGYIGYIDINCIVNNEGIYPLEFTSRFGYPTIQIQLEGITTPTAEWLYRLARGEKFQIQTKRGFQVGVVILVPSYFSYFFGGNNRELIKTYKNLTIIFKNSSNLGGVHIGDVKKDKQDVWRIAGGSGWLLVVTGSGVTVKKARQKTHKLIRDIKIPHMFYRTDIGKNWRVDSKKLRTWGYIN